MPKVEEKHSPAFEKDVYLKQKRGFFILNKKTPKFDVWTGLSVNGQGANRICAG